MRCALKGWHISTAQAVRITGPENIRMKERKITMNRIETMGINDEIFENLRKDFDITLQRLFDKMHQAGETEGSLSVKVKVSLLRDSKMMEGADKAYVFHCPHFDVTVTSSVAQKESTKHGVDMHGYELVRDNTTGYMLHKVSDQMTIEDYEEDE